MATVNLCQAIARAGRSLITLFQGGTRLLPRVRGGYCLKTPFVHGGRRPLLFVWGGHSLLQIV